MKVFGLVMAKLVFFLLMRAGWVMICFWVVVIGRTRRYYWVKMGL